MKKHFANFAAAIAYLAVLAAGLTGLWVVIILAAYPVDFVAIPRAIETGESAVVLATAAVGLVFVIAVIYGYGRGVFWLASWLSNRVMRWFGGPDGD